MSKRLFGFFACSFLVAFIAPIAKAAANHRRVIVIVWDGMRPDFITPELTPNAWRLASGGVTFANHHPVYLSATEVNGTAIATGCYPEHSTIIANKEFRPAIDPKTILHMELQEWVRKGDEVSGGHYLAVPTTAEILHGKGISTVVAGAKGIALLHDRAIRGADASNITLFAGMSLPDGIARELISHQGTFPVEYARNPTRNDWTVQALIERLWRDDVPAFTLLWMNEPDSSQHKFGLGSPQALAALKNVDDNLGRVMAALQGKGILDGTDILLVSDHGFSTISQRVDIAESLRKGGFDAADKGPQGGKGHIIVVSNGGGCLFYVGDHDAATIQRLVDYLQGQDYSGVIFTRDRMEGSFTLAQGKLDSPFAPDVVLSMAWNSDKNTNGVPGMVASGVYDYGELGMHVSLSHYDMHNTLIAGGPDFRKGIVDHLPTGNTDIAPTVLWLLGIKPPKSMDGRTLSEALDIKAPRLMSYEPRRIEASRNSGGKVWKQYLMISEVNGVKYFDEGNSRTE